MKHSLLWSSLPVLLAALIGFFLLREPPVVADDAPLSEVTTVVVVRHAEKQGGGGDVSLTPRGKERAKRLAEIFRRADVDRIFASTRLRTQETVAPLAAMHQLEIEKVKKPASLVARLEALAPGDLAVVAHHSYTLRKILAGLGVAPAQVETLDLDVYDHLFLVLMHPKAKVRLLKLTY